eukprot:g33317.t1
MLIEMVPKSALGLIDVEEATSGAADIVDQFGGLTGEPLSDMKSLLWALSGSPDTVINVAEEEVKNGAGVTAEEGLFHISYEEAGIPVQVPLATPLACRNWEELKEKLFRVKASSTKQMRVSMERDWLGLRERKKQGAFRPSARRIQVYRDWMSIVDEVLGARKLEILDRLEGMGGAPDIGGKFLDQGGENRVKVSGDEFSGAGAARDNGSARAVRFVAFGKEIEPGGMGLGSDEVEAEGCTFHGGEVGVSEKGGEIEEIDVVMAVGNDVVKG